MRHSLAEILMQILARKRPRMPSMPAPIPPRRPNRLNQEPRRSWKPSLIGWYVIIVVAVLTFTTMQLTGW